MNRSTIILLLSIGLYSCGHAGKQEVKDNNYYFDLYTPDDPENNSGTITDKKLIDYKQFETEFKEIDWESYPANPTISIYNNDNILWVALYATSQDADKLQMFIVGHHYKKEVKNILGIIEEKEFSTTHFMVGKEKVLPLFELYFKDSTADKIIEKLTELDKQFKEETQS